MIHLSSTTNLVFKYFLVGCRLEYLGNFNIAVAILLSSGIRTEVEALMSLMATYARAQHQTGIHLQLSWPTLGWLIVFHPLIVWHLHSATPKKTFNTRTCTWEIKIQGWNTDDAYKDYANKVLLSFNGTFCQELVPLDFWLVGLHTQSMIIFHLWCLHRDTCLHCMKSNLFWFIEDPTQFSNSWHAKICLTLMNSYRMVLCSKLHTTSKACSKNLPKIDVVCKTTNWWPKFMLS